MKKNKKAGFAAILITSGIGFLVVFFDTSSDQHLSDSKGNKKYKIEDHQTIIQIKNNKMKPMKDIVIQGTSKKDDAGFKDRHLSSLVGKLSTASFEVEKIGNHNMLKKIFACNINANPGCADGRVLGRVGEFLIYMPSVNDGNGEDKFRVSYDKNNNRFGVWRKLIVVKLNEPLPVEDLIQDAPFKLISGDSERFLVLEFMGDYPDLSKYFDRLRSDERVQSTDIEIFWGRREPQ
jgi:hypothetical protein